MENDVDRAYNAAKRKVLWRLFTANSDNCLPGSEDSYLANVENLTARLDTILNKDALCLATATVTLILCLEHALCQYGDAMSSRLVVAFSHIATHASLHGLDDDDLQSIAHNTNTPLSKENIH